MIVARNLISIGASLPSTVPASSLHAVLLTIARLAACTDLIPVAFFISQEPRTDLSLVECPVALLVRTAWILLPCPCPPCRASDLQLVDQREQMPAYDWNLLIAFQLAIDIAN